MSDYIDKEDAKKAACDSLELYKSEYDVLCDAIDGIQSADVAPIVYGEWMKNENFDDGFWTCSACGFVSEASAAPYLYKYCPHCGAKMQAEG